MTRASASETRLSLLGRLQQQAPADAGAWQEFVAYYGPKIDAWGRHWGLQEADVADVTQAVLIKLATKMRTFVYQSGGSFRAWLKTLARHAWSDFLADRQRAGAGSGDSAVALALLEVPARDDLEDRLAEAFDLEVLEMATCRVRQRVAATTWEAFRLTALDGLSAAEAAARLGMPVANVFKARSNVQKMLQEEVRRLEGSDPP
jgi:RNA polymerase sigma-70 factor (ECF subfamily)